MSRITTKQPCAWLSVNSWIMLCYCDAVVDTSTTSQRLKTVLIQILLSATAECRYRGVRILNFRTDPCHLSASATFCVKKTSALLAKRVQYFNVPR
jgi:hypothetical protein